MGAECKWVNENVLFRIYSIGRNLDKSRIIINDSTISRVHAEISFQKQPFKIFLKDLSSGKFTNNLANGTFLNGKQIDKNTSVEINIGSLFILGDSKKIMKIIGIYIILI